MTARTLLTVAELAAKLNTTERHIRDLRYRRAIPAVKVGALVRFDPDAIDKWLAESADDGVAS